MSYQIEVEEDRIVVTYTDWKDVVSLDKGVRKAVGALGLTIASQVGNNDTNTHAWVLSAPITMEQAEDLEELLVG